MSGIVTDSCRFHGEVACQIRRHAAGVERQKMVVKPSVVSALPVAPPVWLVSAILTGREKSIKPQIINHLIKSVCILQLSEWHK